MKSCNFVSRFSLSFPCSPCSHLLVLAKLCSKHCCLCMNCQLCRSGSSKFCSTAFYQLRHDWALWFFLGVLWTFLFFSYSRPLEKVLATGLRLLVLTCIYKWQKEVFCVSLPWFKLQYYCFVEGFVQGWLLGIEFWVRLGDCWLV